MKRIDLLGLSDVGMQRAQNEDSFLVRTSKDLDLLVVADGMGGHVGGKVASNLAVETIECYIGANHTRLSPQELVADSMTLAHRRILERRDNEPALKGMGTTCTMVLLSPDAMDPERVKAVMGHIGDSKLYHADAVDIRQLSTDHTMLQRMLDAGAIKPEEVKDYAYKNVIYKSLGGADQLQLEPVRQFHLSCGEALLLCSDGLSGYLKPEEMRRILLGTPSLKAAAQYMVNLAKRRGGDDNITVVLASCGKLPRRKEIVLDKVPLTLRPEAAGKPGRRSSPVIGVLLVLLIALLSMLLYLLLNPKGSDTSASQPAIRQESPDPEPVTPGEENGEESLEGLES